MSRAFSTAARNLKALAWKNKGATKDVSWVQKYAEDAVDHVPQLVDIVDSATMQGDPHPTPKNNDPLHGSVEFGKGTTRVVSAHVYADGTVVFSKKYGRIKLPRNPQAPEGSGPAQ
ncbi:hypothetical protein BP00DRAFT_358182 [Aspergillus indologenus CBS 114.80]|uniref:Uncharacterized protein n=1 Tax=Aspergillus indologenus CBS 114.80 TaxID=1450541 RepID=A0A2V5HVE0_9EURO|nr:hypothetical protein BP00DRAFT_358182 [Aspergillus indologenus CBS 114.80]